MGKSNNYWTNGYFGRETTCINSQEKPTSRTDTPANGQLTIRAEDSSTIGHSTETETETSKFGFYDGYFISGRPGPSL
jgi:hypothetical protein